jgi:hypothetical protein
MGCEAMDYMKLNDKDEYMQCKGIALMAKYRIMSVYVLQSFEWHRGLKEV